MMSDWIKVSATLGRGGKVHRAYAVRRQWGLQVVMMACTCPGSNRGSLANRSRIVAEGWEAGNCRNYRPTAD